MANLLPEPLHHMLQRRILLARLLFCLAALAIAFTIAHQVPRSNRMLVVGEWLAGAIVPVAVSIWIEHLVLRLWKMPGITLTSTGVDPEQSIVSDPRWLEGAHGRSAAFTYIDVDGVVTDRHVVNWLSEGPHIKAHCLSRKAGRTFRKDRIENWSA